MGEERLEGVEVDRLELAEALHPDRGGFQRVGLELAPFHAASLLLRDEARRGEDAEMLEIAASDISKEVGTSVTSMSSSSSMRRISRRGRIGEGQRNTCRARRPCPSW